MECLIVPILRKVDFTPEAFLERQLPLPGELKVEIGEEVKPFTVVGEAVLGLKEELVNLSRFLGVAGGKIEQYLTKRAGEGFTADEILAKKRGFLGLDSKILTAPFNGVVRKIDREKGEMLLSTVPEKFILTAGAPGKVINLVPNLAVLLQISAVQVRGVWARGRAVEGELVVLSDYDEPLELAKIIGSLKGKIIAGGSFISPEVLRKAAAVGVRGIISGGTNVLPDKFFTAADCSFLLTEGFGIVPMSESTWRYLKSVETRMVMMLPERKTLLIPEKLPPEDGRREKFFKTLEVNDRVQILAWPHFGRVGVAAGFNLDETFPSGLKAPAVLVNLADEKETVAVPLRNVGVLV